MVNAYLVRDRQSILVDTGYPGSGERILNALTEQGIDPRTLALILLTHGHGDHFGSAPELRERLRVPVAIHQADAEFLRKGINPPPRPTGLVGRFLRVALAGKSAAGIRPVEPDILLHGETDLAAYGIEGRLLPTPGHTPGSVSVILAGGQVIIGDLLMGGLVRQKRPGYPLFADDLAQVRESVRAVMRQAPKTIYCAHGGPFTPEAVVARFPWAVSA
jgi:glyoxylase-like metal-dependent hydrolase (beta-lactamase superfamily II)